MSEFEILIPCPSDEAIRTARQLLDGPEKMPDAIEHLSRDVIRVSEQAAAAYTALARLRERHLELQRELHRLGHYPPPLE